MEPVPKDERRFYRVRELCELLGVSKGKVFAALREGKLKALKLDGVLLIPVESVKQYLATAVPWRPPHDRTAPPQQSRRTTTWSPKRKARPGRSK